MPYSTIVQEQYTIYIFDVLHTIFVFFATVFTGCAASFVLSQKLKTNYTSIWG